MVVALVGRSPTRSVGTLRGFIRQGQGCGVQHESADGVELGGAFQRALPAHQGWRTSRTGRGLRPAQSQAEVVDPSLRRWAQHPVQLAQSGAGSNQWCWLMVDTTRSNVAYGKGRAAASATVKVRALA